MKIIKTIKEVSKLPRVSISLDVSLEGKRIYKSFTSKHPKYLLIKNKTIGVALIKTDSFKKPEDYTQSVNGKNSAAYFSRKAGRNGFLFQEINLNDYQKDIAEINQSASNRQGREMDDSYKKEIDYPINKNNIYFGIFKDNKLTVYLWVVKTGELCILNRILGHSDFLDAGIMYLLVTSYVEYAIQNSNSTKYIMYDTFFGASDGLKLFKKRCGFQPYLVTWKQE